MIVRAARAALASVSFLTVLPVARWTTLDADDVRRAAPLFPLVGAGIGAVMGAVAWWLEPRTGPLVAGGLAVAAGAALTGALHLDALADAADGFGGRTREDALRIMRDHQLGAYGVVALVLDLLVKTAAVAEPGGPATPRWAGWWPPERCRGRRRRRWRPPSGTPSRRRGAAGRWPAGRHRAGGRGHRGWAGGGLAVAVRATPSAPHWPGWS